MRPVLLAGMMALVMGMVNIPLGAQPLDREEALQFIFQGDQCIKAEDFRGALEFYGQAYPYFRKNGDFYYLAYLGLWTGEAYYIGGDFQKALEVTLEGLEHADRHLNTDTLSFYSLIHQNLGVFYALLGDFDRQMHHYQIAFEQDLRKDGRNSQRGADAFFNLGAAYGRRGQWDRFIAYTDTSLQISREVKYQEGMASAYLNLSYGYAVKKDFVRAIGLQKQALRLTRTRDERAKGYNNLGMLYLDIDEPGEALKFLNMALDIRRTINPPFHENVISTLLNLAKVYRAIGDLDLAGERIDQAIRALQQAPEPNPSFLKLAYIDKAAIALAEGNRKKAEEQAWIATTFTGRQLETEAGAWMMLSRVLGAQGRYEEALHILDRAFEIRSDQLENISLNLDLLEEKGRLLLEKGEAAQDPADLEEGLAVCRKADSLVMFSRRTFQDKASREFLSADARELYTDAVALCYSLFCKTQDPAYVEMAFHFSEKNKSLSLAEKINDLYAQSFAGIPRAMVERERRLLQEIEFYANQILDAGDDPASVRLVGEWEDILFAKRQEQDTLLKEMRYRYPEYYDLRFNFDIAPLEDFQRALISADEVLVEYFLGKEWLYILVLGPATHHFSRVKLPGNFLQAVNAFRQSLLGQDERFFEQSHQFYQLLLAPVAGQIEGKSLIIVPDGILGYIPFEALLTAPVKSENFKKHRSLPYLLRSHRVRYYFSAHLAFLVTNYSKPVRSGKVLALAPDFSAGNMVSLAGEVQQLSPLPGAQKEAGLLEELFHGLFLTRTQAQEKAFKENVEKFSILHIGTHTLLDDRFPGLSKMIFHPDPEGAEDGLLNAYELFNLHIRAELGVLSACNTGIGAIKTGEGIASLARAFAYAGCPNLIMSLWQVRDRTTPVLLRHFYIHLKAGMGKAEALHQAKLKYLDEYNSLLLHPYYWAGFIYVGEDHPVGLRSKNRGRWYGLLLIPGIAVCWFWWRRRKQKPEK